jgi:hypothetical protein
MLQPFRFNHLSLRLHQWGAGMLLLAAERTLMMLSNNTQYECKYMCSNVAEKVT